MADGPNEDDYGLTLDLLKQRLAQSKDAAKPVQLVVTVVLVGFVLLALPVMLDSYWLQIMTGVVIYSILALGLGLLIGRVGMVSLCQFVLLAIGAWVALRLSYATDLPFPVLVLLAGLITGVIGTLIGLPALRLSGLYLALIRVLNWRVPVAIYATVAAFAGILHLTDPVRFASPLFMTFSGGLALGAVYMATDPVTSPMTAWCSPASRAVRRHTRCIGRRSSARRAAAAATSFGSPAPTATPTSNSCRRRCASTAARSAPRNRAPSVTCRCATDGDRMRSPRCATRRGCARACRRAPSAYRARCA